MDAFSSSELATGWLTKIEEHLALPFATTVLGVDLEVRKIDILSDDTLVAVCARGRQRQAIVLCDLPLPQRRPAGSEWIEAYSRWLKDQA